MTRLQSILPNPNYKWHSFAIFFSSEPIKASDFKLDNASEENGIDVTYNKFSYLNILESFLQYIPPQPSQDADRLANLTLWKLFFPPMAAILFQWGNPNMP